MAGPDARGIAAAPKNRRLALSIWACVLVSAVLYYPVIAGLAGQWLDDPNYTHGLAIPFISALILWRRRESLRSSRPGGGLLPGTALLALSAALLVAGTAASELFAARISIPVLLLGAVLFLAGRDFASRAAFPILFLLMMVPLPYIIYYKISFPMQIMSAKLSSALLDALHVSVIRRGNILMLPGYTLEVVAACSGLRSLMTMITLGLVIAAFSDLSPPRRAAIAAFSVPAAIAANTVRLAVTAIGAYTVGPEFADGTLHEISGLIVFAAGFILMMIFLGIMKWTR